jgi:RimJ/RimL family protein N-acetyltransferase
VAAVAAALGDPEVIRWTPTRQGVPASRFDPVAEAREWLERRALTWADGTAYGFAVLAGDAPGARPVAHVAVRDLGPGRTEGEVGYWTLPGARGRGVAPRALEALTGWVLGPRGPASAAAVLRITLRHQADNTASCRVAEKCGYALDGILPPLPPMFPGEGHRHVRARRP